MQAVRPSDTWFLRAVRVQFRDTVGNASAAYSDTIVYELPYRVFLPVVMRGN